MTDTVGRSINHGRVIQSSSLEGMQLLLQIYLVYFLLLILCLYFFFKVRQHSLICIFQSSIPLFVLEIICLVKHTYLNY